MTHRSSSRGARTGPTRIEIISEEEIFNKSIFVVREARLRYERYDGSMSREVLRLNLDRGDSVAALVHDVTDDHFVLTEQFRYPAHKRGHGWMIEIPAGMMDAQERVTDAVRREIREEVGYRVKTLKRIGAFYATPGGSSEWVHLYYAKVDSSGKLSDGGGSAHEEEDIRVVRLTPQDALKELDRGRIVDAKTIVALQWFARINPP